jgi:hypothetical protein
LTTETYRRSALALLDGTTFAATFSQSQIDALALLFLHVHGDGVGLANVFWGRRRCRAFSAHYLS